MSKTIHIWTAVLLVLALCLSVGCQKNDSPNPTGAAGEPDRDSTAPEPAEAGDAEEPLPDNGNPLVTITMDDGSEIVVELYPEVAPLTVNNFIGLIKTHYYDGLTFHRIVPGFVIQGGDPSGDGTGGPGYAIKGEFLTNGVENSLSHTRGVISMARSQDPNSAGSQFFIVVDDAAVQSLDGQYAGFGKVVRGMDVVDEIVNAPNDGSAMNMAVEPRVMKAVTVETFGISYPNPEPYVEEVVDQSQWSREDNPQVTITMDGGGVIVVELYPEVAPLTVANFVSLIQSGFYDGLTFHRIVPGFVIQGGDPNGDGSGGPDYSIKGEFSENGVSNNLSHRRGVISMARTMDPNSAGSQFFIVVDDAAIPSLDGSYAGFGMVVEGMDVVDEIVSAPNDESPMNMALEPRVMESVTVETFGIDYGEPDKISN